MDRNNPKYIFFPGVGTIIVSFLGEHRIIGEQLLIGVIQFVLAFLLIGWIWSIVWGVLILQKAH